LAAGREGLCDYFDNDLLKVYEGIICWKDPSGITEGQSVEQAEAADSQPLPDDSDSEVISNIAADNTFGFPEVVPLDGEPVGEASNGATLVEGEGSGDIETFDGNPVEDTNQFDEEVDSDDELFLASTTSLNSIACLPNGELMISFSTQPAPPPSYLVVTVGDQLLRQLPIDGYYFVGPSPAEMVLRLIVMTEQPDNYERLGEQYSIPACRPSAASPQSAQPNCPPPEFFDPLMNRCRIIGNEQPNEPPPDDGYTPPDD